MDTQLDGVMPPLTRIKPKHTQPRYGWKRAFQSDDSFMCKYCQAYVHTLPVLSRVQNRNHCPYCLWSRHLDQYKAGDRLSACKANMQPIGLTVKPNRNKYGSNQPGELMLVHRCNECGMISINRIAADDLEVQLLQVLLNSATLDAPTRDKLSIGGIHLLETRDARAVFGQLYGTMLK